MLGITYHYSQSSGLELIVSAGAARRYPWHMHTAHWTIGIVNSGSVLLETKAKAHRYHSGGSFVVPPWTVHRLDIAPATTVTTLCVAAIKMREGTPLSAANMQLMGMPDSLSPSALTEIFGRAAGAAQAATATETPTQAIARLLLEHPENSCEIGELAQHAGYSPWYFLRKFHKDTGLTPHAFQVICRVRQLRVLLRKGIKPAEAAVAAGFCDQSHMHKVFQQHHGLTPRQFCQASHPAQ